MAVSKYDKKKLTEEQQNQIQALTDSAESGVMSWDDAHEQAEKIRSTANYSGGADGSEYNPFASGTNGQKQSGFSSGDNQTGFDASRYTALSAAPVYGGSRADSALRAAAQNLVDMNYTDWTKGGAYKALAERYGQQGTRAMQDVLGQIAARTGGLASSYAASASQQQYNDYMAKLEDVARQMYSSERSDQMDNVNLLRSLSSDEYSRYLNRLNQWNQDRSFAYSAGRDALSDARYDEETAYSRLRDALADTRYDQQYADSRADTAWNQNLTERQYADARADTMYSRAKEASAPRLDLDTALSMYASGVQSSEVMKTLQHYLGDNADAASLDAAAALKSADETAEMDYEGLFSAALNDVYSPEAFIKNNYKKYGFSSSNGLDDAFESWRDKNEEEAVSFESVADSPAAKTVGKLLKSGTAFANALGIKAESPKAAAYRYLEILVENGLDEKTATVIAKHYGIEEE